jgi:hypothetical protein
MKRLPAIGTKQIMNPLRLTKINATQILCLGVSMLSACANLLPAGETRVGLGWRNFEQARGAFEAIQPYHSNRADVHAMGLDPFKNPSVSMLSYSDVLQRFGTGSVLRADQLERGVRECMESGKRCTGYQLIQKELRQKRIGNVWLDLFNFRRETEAEGWSFNGLIIFVDDQVVITLFGGQPKIHELNIQQNPLGPLQSLPERAGQGRVNP